MNWIAIAFIIFGICKITVPKYFRFYKMWEIFGEREQPGRLEVILERIFGLVIMTAGVFMLVTGRTQV